MGVCGGGGGGGASRFVAGMHALSHRKKFSWVDGVSVRKVGEKGQISFKNN